MVTTIMLRNIPNRYTQTSLIEEIDGLGFAGRYDFFYLPMDVHNRTNVGYAFINFLTPADCQRFFSIFREYMFKRHSSKKIAGVSQAHVQGLVNNLEHFLNRAVTQSRDSQYRPVVFVDGQRRELAEALEELQSRAATGMAPPPSEDQTLCSWERRPGGYGKEVEKLDAFNLAALQPQKSSHRGEDTPHFASPMPQSIPVPKTSPVSSMVPPVPPIWQGANLNHMGRMGPPPANDVAYWKEEAFDKNFVDARKAFEDAVSNLLVSSSSQAVQDSFSVAVGSRTGTPRSTGSSADSRLACLEISFGKSYLSDRPGVLGHEEDLTPRTSKQLLGMTFSSFSL
jgi:hypothetical protein